MSENEEMEPKKDEAAEEAPAAPAEEPKAVKAKAEKAKSEKAIAEEPEAKPAKASKKADADSVKESPEKPAQEKAAAKASKKAAPSEKESAAKAGQEKPATKAEVAASSVEAKPEAMARMQERYRKDVLPALMKELGYANVMQAPRIVKISVNIGLGEAIQNSKALEAASGDLALVTGQKPVIAKARRSIAVYKLREGMPIGVMVTLRGRRMWDFLDRFINIVLPRQRDFQGVSPDSFDGRGNYSVGLREQLVFPEIEYDKVDRVRGLEVTIVTTSKTDEEARRMLALMGMPFRR